MRSAMTDAFAEAATWRDTLGQRLGSVVMTAELQHAAAAVIADELAAGVAGWQNSQARAYVKGRSQRGGEASVLGGGHAERSVAAGSNALLIGWSELDGGYRRAGCHAALYTFPAVAAEAEATQASIADVFEALVVGYEAATTIARRLRPDVAAEVHPHSHLAPLGTAAAVTWMRSKDATAVIRAMDLAATLAPHGAYDVALDGMPVRNLWVAAGASSGFLAAGAAIAGIDPDPRALDGILTPGEDTHGGVEWAIEDRYHKPFAACQYAHAAIAAASPFGAIRADDVARVTVLTHPAAARLNNLAPATELGGKFSVPHVVAATLTTGRTDADVFSDTFLNDSDVALIRSRVEVRTLDPLPPYPGDRPAIVIVDFHDGTTRTTRVDASPGSPENPMDQASLIAKIDALTSAEAPGVQALARSLLAGEWALGQSWAELARPAMRL
jgi:2-methylcitrate dehydratase PrpD